MADRNKNEFEDTHTPIEGWYLTAYALGELDEASRKLVEAWLTKHPEGHQEIEAIRQTASSVERELGNFPVSTRLDAARSIKIKEAISLAGTPSVKAAMSEDRVETKRRRLRILLAITSGLAAGLAGFAFWSSRPTLNHFAFQGPFLELSEANRERINEAVTETEEFGILKEGEELNRLTDESSVASDPSLLNREDQSTELAKKQTLPELKALAKDKQLSAAAGASHANALPAGPIASYSRGGQGIGGGGGSGGGGPTGGKTALGAGGLGAPGLGAAGYGGDMGESGSEGMSQRGLVMPSSGLGGMPNAAAAPGFSDRFAVTDKADASKATDSKSTDGLKSDDLGEFPDELRSNVPSRRKQLQDKENMSGDRFESIPETPFSSVAKDPLSTFSIDVDTASYSKLRQYVLENNVVPPPSAIRIEEWLNYFDYQYPGPTGNDPFAAHMKMGDCPWNTKHKLVRVAIQAKKVANQERPNSNLVFLIDVSGSMADANKLPLVKRTLGLLTAQLREQDRVAIVVYAGASGCVLPSTSGVQKDQILASISELQSGGSTNGGQGIELAYKIAKENFIPGGVNRVILCTDGDFNVGVTGTDALVSMMQEKAKSNIFLTCLGYGIGNYNDSMMEQISDKGNGVYAMVDSETEARRVMTEQLSGTLMTVAKDVKIQIEFNPAKVHSYRLIGYENRRLAAADFNNDKKDAGEIGAGHRVTALYEIVPVGQEDGIPGAVDELRYSKTSPQEPKASVGDSGSSKDWLLLKVRSKQPESSQSTKQEFVLGEVASQMAYEGEQNDFDWAVSVAEFGLLMRRSQMAPGMDWEKMLSRAMDSVASDPYRRECITIMQRAKDLSIR
ncbi:MAG: von Willebrand factor type A domain-containing protein [Planctomycetota bacterium]